MIVIPVAAIAHPRRQRILQLVWDRERSAGEIARLCPEVTFGAVSQHLRVLHEAGVVRQRREGRGRFYLADRAALGPLGVALEAMWSDALSELKRLAEGEQRAIDAVKKAKSQDLEPDPGRAARARLRTEN